MLKVKNPFRDYEVSNYRLIVKTVKIWVVDFTRFWLTLCTGYKTSYICDKSYL